MKLAQPGLRLVAQLCGRKGLALFAVGAASSFVLSGVEYSYAVFLMVFAFTLGFVAHTDLPAWLPFDVRLLSPAAIWAGLLAVGIAQAAAQVVTYQTKIMFTELIHARLRMALGYCLLKRENGRPAPLSQVDFYLAECFPKATAFLFHATQLFSFAVQSLMISVGMIYLAWGEALVGVSGLVLMGFLVLQLNRWTNRVAGKVPDAVDALQKTKVRIVRNWILIKILQIQEREYRKYLDSVFKYYKHSSLAYFYGNLGGAVMPVLGIVVIAAIVVSNLRFFRTPAVDLIAFLYLFVKFQTRVANGSNLIGGIFICRPQFRESMNMLAALSRGERLEAFRPQRHFSLFKAGIGPGDLPAESPGEPAPRRRRDGGPPAIRVDGVGFAYPGMQGAVLDGLSLNLDPGLQMGIVGPNGSGKSTLLGIILGVQKPTRGNVYIDGIQSAEYVTRHADGIAYVGAEPYLILGTVMENLTYGLARACTEQEAWAALGLVRMEDFVRGLPEGLGYLIQENGEGLSTGQKQRLTIARAFLRDPALLVLDEPSANLDESGEAVVVDALGKLKGLCTVLIVSHKPEVLKGSDRTLELGVVPAGQRRMA